MVYFFQIIILFSMRLIIHDLENLDFSKLSKNDFAVQTNSCKNCIGCFNCWVKTPLKCVLNDDMMFNGKKLLDSEELIIISKCVYGSYSSKVKRILERCISYVEPFFTLRENEIHHRMRDEKKLKFKIFFYGDNFSDEYKDTAIKLIKANQKNLNTEEPNVYFINNLEEICI